VSATRQADTEGPPGIGRVEAYSDGVIAIIVTIMVLELHPPLSEGMDKLWTLWPVFLAYILSYAYVSIYWVNHHRLFSHATVVSNALLWSNILLLFALSLVPFSTSYLGEHHFSRAATWLYLATMLFPAMAYTWLQTTIRKTGRRGSDADAYHRRTSRKGIAATMIYASGLPLTFLSPWMGIGCAVIVAMLWFLPNSPLDRIFDAPKTGQAHP
jgi:uncharacterized membrane protein